MMAEPAPPPQSPMSDFAWTSEDHRRVTARIANRLINPGPVTMREWPHWRAMPDHDGAGYLNKITIAIGGRTFCVTVEETTEQTRTERTDA